MIPEQASLLRFYVNASSRWRGKPVYRALVETARAMHLAGASVFPVELSFGAHRQLRDARSDYQFADVPVVFEMVDAHASIEQLLDALRPMVTSAFATIEPVRVARYAHHEDPPLDVPTDANPAAPAPTTLRPVPGPLA